MILLVSLLGCAVIHVTGAKPEIERRVGIVNVQVKEVDDQPAIISTTGFGITLGSNTATLGWLHEVVITAPDAAKCRVFIIVEKKDDIEGLKLTLKEIGRFESKICIISKEGEKWPK
jgi:hypothetical protein